MYHTFTFHLMKYFSLDILKTSNKPDDKNFSSRSQVRRKKGSSYHCGNYNAKHLFQFCCINDKLTLVIIQGN